jgi:hypothetical protein
MFRGLFDLTFFEGDGIADIILKINVSMVDLRAQSSIQDALQTGRVHPVLVVKKVRWPSHGMYHNSSFLS